MLKKKKKKSIFSYYSNQSHFVIPMKAFGHQTFQDEPKYNQTQPENTANNTSIMKNCQKTNTDSNEYTINSQILSSITEMSSYNSYGDFDEKNPSKSTLNDNEIGSKSITSTDDHHRVRKKKQITSVLEAIFKNCRGRTKMTDKICRLCLYDNNLNDFGSLITPCKCRGNLKHVHEECMKTFLVLRKHDLDRTFCESCKTQIRMKIEYKNSFYPEKIFKEGLISFLIAFLLFLVLCCLLFILTIYLAFFEMDGSILNLKEDFKDNRVLFILALSIGWIVCFFSVCVGLLSNLNEACFVKRIQNWKILNCTQANEQKKEALDEEEEAPQGFFRKWCPLHFLRFRETSEPVSNKIQNKYEFFIISKEIFKVKQTIIDESKKSPIKNNSPVEFDKPSAKFNIEIQEKFSAVANPTPENPEKIKKTGKINFTFRVDENFPSKSIPNHEEPKPKLGIQNDQIIDIKPVTKDLLNEKEAYSFFHEKNVKVESDNYDIPIIARGLTKNRRNSFQNNLKRVSKERLLEDINNVTNVISKAFINQDFNSFVRIKIILKIHSFSLEYVRKINRNLELKNKNTVKPNARITESQIDKKKMLCLKKKSHE